MLNKLDEYNKVLEKTKSIYNELYENKKLNVTSNFIYKDMIDKLESKIKVIVYINNDKLNELDKSIQEKANSINDDFIEFWKNSIEEDLAQLKYEKEIDKILSRKTIKQREDTNNVFICKTPVIFSKVGLDMNKDITMRRGKMRFCNTPIEEGGHSITKEQLYNIPKLLEEPAIIMKSQTVEKSVLAILNDVDVRNMPILVALSPDEKGFYNFETIDTNLLLSIYGRKNFEKFIKDNEDRILMKDDKQLEILRDKIEVNKQKEKTESQVL
ncbi:MAG: hypothetical protein IJ593_12635 [Lachnospiraceae bacterium]|nr:hypothetical protein [Lachnospiraceae bacterium]MBR1455469.1 hypothetical protein [Lachnospiraceae bacterium]